MECKPLELTNQIAEKYYNCWKELEEIREDKSIDWDRKRCYIPIGACMSVVMDKANFNQQTVALEGQIMAATASWRLHKQIYRFTPEIEEMLMQQHGDEDTIVPVDIFDNLPYQCLYIKLTTSEEYDGFFVHFESDVNNGMLELRLLIIDKENNCIAQILYLEKDKTIKDAMNDMINIARKNMTKNLSKFVSINSKEYVKRYIDNIQPFLQLVLYICSENKEIEENSEQKKITRKPKNKAFIKDKFREVQIWDLGLQTTEIIRKYNKSHININKIENKEVHTTNKSGTPKRPHSRRGHWHHYWKGTIGTDERRLVLKWVAPTFIHSGTTAVQVNIIQK